MIFRYSYGKVVANIQEKPLQTGEC